GCRGTERPLTEPSRILPWPRESNVEHPPQYILECQASFSEFARGPGAARARVSGAGAAPVSGHPLRAPGSRTPHGMKSDMRNGAGSRLVSGHPLMAPGPRTPHGMKSDMRNGA